MKDQLKAQGKIVVERAKSWASANWCILALVALIVGAGIYTFTQDDFSAEKRQDARVDSALAVRESALEKAEDAHQRADSLRREVRKVRSRETALRDSISELQATVDSLIVLQEEEFVASQSNTDSVMQQLLEKVRPEIKPFVLKKVIPAVQEERTNAEKLIASQRRQINLLVQDTASLVRENRSLVEANQGLLEENKRLHGVVRQDSVVIGELRTARNMWRSRAQTRWYESFLGEGVWEAAGTLGSGVLAWTVDDSRRVFAGWSIARGADLAVGLVKP